MTTSGSQTHPVSAGHPETAAGRLSRIEREEAVIARAEADIEAGLGIDDDVLERWLDTLDQDEDTPLPAKRTGQVID